MLILSHLHKLQPHHNEYHVLDKSVRCVLLLKKRMLQKNVHRESRQFPKIVVKLLNAKRRISLKLTRRMLSTKLNKVNSRKMKIQSIRILAKFPNTYKILTSRDTMRKKK